MSLGQGRRAKMYEPKLYARETGGTSTLSKKKKRDSSLLVSYELYFKGNPNNLNINSYKSQM